MRVAFNNIDNNRIKSENLRGKDQEDEFQLTFKGLTHWNTDCTGGELIVMLVGTPITGHESKKRDGRMLEREELKKSELSRK